MSLPPGLLPVIGALLFLVVGAIGLVVLAYLILVTSFVVGFFQNRRRLEHGDE